MQPLVALTYARRYQGAAVLLVVALSLCDSLAAAMGALLGGALMALHVNLLFIIARTCLRPGAQASLPRAAVLLLSKFCVMAALTAALLLVVRPHATGFLAGLSTFAAGMAGAAVGYRKTGAPHDSAQATRF